MPRLARMMPRPFTWSVMKGLGNYVCRSRLAQFEQQLSLVDDPVFSRLRAWVDDFWDDALAGFEAHIRNEEDRRQ